MRLFHGSNVAIDQVDLSLCKPYKDFGCGFYTTMLEEQAWRMAKRRVAMEGTGVPTVTVFEAPDDLSKIQELSCRVFPEHPTVAWAVFINNNRDPRFSDIASLECNTDNKYDVVIGPVADDTVGLLIRRFSRGIIDTEALKRGFDFNSLTNQVTFHSERALKYLRREGVLCDDGTAGND